MTVFYWVHLESSSFLASLSFFTNSLYIGVSLIDPHRDWHAMSHDCHLYLFFLFVTSFYLEDFLSSAFVSFSSFLVKSLFIKKQYFVARSACRTYIWYNPYTTHLWHVPRTSHIHTCLILNIFSYGMVMKQHGHIDPFKNWWWKIEVESVLHFEAFF